MADRTLLVLRHAKSDWGTGEPDTDRPLAERGYRDAAAAGEVLTEYKLDRVLISPAMRARQTWAAAQQVGASCASVQVVSDIYHGMPEDLIFQLRGLGSEISTALLIGHQPSLGELILSLARPSELAARVASRFPTCGLAELAFPGRWADLDLGVAEVRRYLVPRG